MDKPMTHPDLKRVIEEIVNGKGAQFSDCRKYRYVLWRIWDEHKDCVVFIGLNPSTANEIEDDPTIRRCIGYAKDWGFGGLYMLNLFAFRATNPKELKRASFPIGFTNNRNLIIYSDLRLTVACWGTQGTFMNRDKGVIELLGREKLSCLGITKEGHPKHPLYLRRDAKLIKLR